MIATRPDLTVRLARGPEEVAAAERLRYSVFVSELGGNGAMVDHEAKRERDRFDAAADQLVLLDEARPDGDQVVGLYRLLRSDGAAQIGEFYSEAEFDLSPLKSTGLRLLELGRSCLHPEYRGGTAMFHLWQGLSEYVTTHEIDILFGTASFRGTDLQALSGALTLLHREHLAPPALRVTSRCDAVRPYLVEGDLDRPAAMRSMPALIKAYLRLGGLVGEGAFVDHDFNTTDVCMVLEVARMTERQRALYRGRQ